MTATTLIIIFLIAIAWFLGPWPAIQIAFTLVRLAVKIVVAFIQWRL